MADGIVLYQVDDKVGFITLNRLEKLNAISRELSLVALYVMTTWF